MNNSRSQTKIRKTQQVNLIAEQRYLKQKGLLSESIDDFFECFDSFGLTMDQVPQSCKMVTNKDEFTTCKNDINSAMMQMGRPSGFEKLFTCLETRAQNLGLLIEPVTPEEEPPTEEEPEEEK
jgi:hypothetical protein